MRVVRQKANKMGLKKRDAYRPWTKDEMDLFAKLYTNVSTKEIADKLGRSAKALEQKAHQMGIRKAAPYWSKAEERLLTKLYPNTNTKAIADKVGRSPATVIQKAFRMGLRKKMKHWSKLSRKI